MSHILLKTLKSLKLKAGFRIRESHAKLATKILADKYFGDVYLPSFCPHRTLEL